MGADYKPRLYSVALTKRQIRQLAKLEALPGRFGRVGGIFSRKLDYINYAEHRGIIVAIARAPFTSEQEAALEVEDLDEERGVLAMPA